METLNNIRNWQEFNSGNSVGIVLTSLSEQFVKESFNTFILTPDNYKEEIELFDIDTVFIDNDLYEKDHEWHNVNRGHIVNYLKSENINLVVIKNTTLEVKTVFNNAFLMMFNPNITEYIYKNNILNVPLIIDTEFNNPVELNKNIDILYFIIGKFIASTHVNLFNKYLYLY